MGNDSSVPILNMKTQDKCLSLGCTAEISKVLCYNRVQTKKEIREGIRFYILDMNTKAVSLKCLTEGVNIIDKVVSHFSRSTLSADKGRRYQLFEKRKGVMKSHYGSFIRQRTRTWR